MTGTSKATNESQREHVTREVGFLWQVYKPLSDFDPKRCLQEITMQDWHFKSYK